MTVHHTLPHDSAGRVMTEQVPMVQETMTVREVERYLFKEIQNIETIDYLYVVDRDGVLVGVLSIKELFRADRAKHVGSFMVRTPVTVRAHTDQERAAFLALRHSIKAVPVVDASHRLLGILATDDILRILDHEATEDAARFSGVRHHAGFDTVMTLPLMTSVMHRLPWLVLGLAGGFLTAGIIARFETMLSTHLILVTFIPLIVYLAGVIGTQMTTMIVRDLAVSTHFTFVPYLVRQGRVVAVLGIILGTLMFFSTWFFYELPRVGFVLAIALVCAALASLVTSVVLPYSLYHFRFDPANAGGPLSIVLQDMLSVAIYLSVAMLLMP